MRRRRALAAVAVSLVLGAPGVQAQTPASGGGQVLTFAEEVPCPPAERPAARAHRVRHRIRRKPVVLHRVALPVRPRRPHRVVAKHVVHKHRPALVRASAPLAPTRCSVLRHERLTNASFAVTPDVAELAPIADDVQPGGPALTSLTSGRPALPSVINPTAGGGQPGSPGSVSPAPEPSQWLLMLFGVAALGVSLRRRRPKALPIS